MAEEVVVRLIELFSYFSTMAEEMTANNHVEETMMDNEFLRSTAQGTHRKSFYVVRRIFLKSKIRKMVLIMN